jgi:hypothetical protein
LAVGGDEQEADYQSTSLTASQDRYLEIDSNGFYNYTSGTETKFKRKIIVTDETDYEYFEEITELGVEVIVEWNERGKQYNTEVISHLYNWYGN